MSVKTDFSWESLEEHELLTNVDKEIKLISSSSESNKSSKFKTQQNDAIGENARIVAENFRKSQILEYVSINLNEENPADFSKPKLYSSYQDLTVSTTSQRPIFCQSPKSFTPKSKPIFNRSVSCINLSHNRLPANRQYDHVESKVKKYIQGIQEPTMQQNIGLKFLEKKDPEAKAQHSNENLAEINKQLSNELKEKNEILLRMQENYQSLLLKYAEAQNRIDELRLKSTTYNEVKVNNKESLEQVFFDDFDSNCQKAIVAPIVKSVVEDRKSPKINIPKHTPKQRPFFLPLEANLPIDKDHLVVETPTDSEEVSSVVTSMSGHSKILTTLDEETQNKILCDEAFLTEEILKMSSIDFSVSKNPSKNDPYDKVKNWQNSLPPLELIETPDTGLYDVIMGDEVSPSTCYKDLNLSNRSKNAATVTFSKRDLDEENENSNQKLKMTSQELMKKYLRKLSLPSNLSKRTLMSMVYKHKSHHTIDVCLPKYSSTSPKIKEYDAGQRNESLESFSPDRPPFVRSSSVPVGNSPVLGKYRNDIFIPSLDLENLTLSEDGTTPKVTGASKSNFNSSSFVASHNCSADSLFHTEDSINSCKATVSQYSENECSVDVKPTFHKSTSITPDRSKDMILQVVSKNNDIKVPKKLPSDNFSYASKPNISIINNAASNFNNVCNICGELTLPSVSEIRSSFQSVNNDSNVSNKSCLKKYPFNRSVSFTSETNSTRCQHNDEFQPTQSNEFNIDQLDRIDNYTNNLKARSKVVMKALTAHVNNT